MTQIMKILVVDDEESFLRSAVLSLRLSGEGDATGFSDPRQVLPYLANNEVNVIVLDINMPYLNGFELLKEIIANYPSIAVIMSTAESELQTAIDCMKTGAVDYLTKPFDEKRFVSTVKQAIDKIKLMNEAGALKEYLLRDDIKQHEAFEEFLTTSPKMFNLFKYVEVISPTDLPILITGETGVGKELFSKAIHKLSGKQGKFISINAAGIDDSIFCDTLFGHVKGAFTGADKLRKGLLEEADAGTIFLDEIGDLKPETQVKLLRLLQDGSYFQVGGDFSKQSGARIVAATNRDVKALSESGEFRKDLYYRLRAHEIRVPALKERKEDIRILVNSFVEQACKIFHKSNLRKSNTTFAMLENYSFPGNIRELRGLIFDTVSRSDGEILNESYIKDYLFRSGATTENLKVYTGDESITYPDILPNAEEWSMLLIKEALRRTAGNKTIASNLIGLSRQSLIRKLKEEHE